MFTYYNEHGEHEEINSLRPKVENQLKTSMNWEFNLTYFIHAKVLLKILQNAKYYEGEEFKNL